LAANAVAGNAQTSRPATRFDNDTGYIVVKIMNKVQLNQLI
jgi:hypothetical protein